MGVNTVSVYYEERKGLITQTISLSLEELLNSFIQGYHYFNRKGSFELAFKGANHEDRWTHEIICILPPTMAPSPNIFLSRVCRINIYSLLENITKAILKKSSFL